MKSKGHFCSLVAYGTPYNQDLIFDAESFGDLQMEDIRPYNRKSGEEYELIE